MITVKIERDPDPMNPRTEYDNAGIMACWHNRYTLGDVQPKCEPTEWLEDNAPEGSVVLPLFLYDHSGITMSTGAFSCSFDSGQVGVIVADPETIQKEWNGDREAAEKYLKGSVELYDQFLRGECYGFTIESTGDDCECCGVTPEPEHVDSCWGFFGDALDAMKDHVEDEHHAALEKAWNGGML
jgi:hypothetical protein